ncbi:MAG: ATP-binding cassette domain-containing protein, partial [Bacteroidota bacterium]|nr:ATP-binding cassette domain-containing protein [Bacteroidota bacterium]
FLIRRKMGRVRRTAKPVSEKALQYLQEALAGFVDSSIYGCEDFFVRRYDACQSAFNGFLADQQVIQNIPSKLIEVFAVFGFFVLVLINSYTGNTNTIQLITIGAFMGAAYKIIPGIVRILNSVGQIRTYGFTAAELAAERNKHVQRGAADKATIRSIGFSDVSFWYADEPVLRDFSMSLCPGEMVGLSGVSGKGKTTVVNLLLGFIEPSSGSISINGQKMSAPERRKYWSQIAYVKQQPFMISDTVLRNIVLSEQAEDPARLEMVFSKLGLDGPGGVFPEGSGKLLTEDGRNISGGQRQRIAFARALYKKADLLILDEPFNELDEASEGILLGYCRQLAAEGMAILLITHNSKSLTACDKIVSLNGS